MSAHSPSRGISTSRLPPINKHLLNKKIVKNKVKGIQVSFQLLNPTSRPRIQSNGSNQRIKHKQSNKRIGTHRQRTDSAGSQLNKYVQHKSFDTDILNQKETDNTMQNFHKNVLINKQYIHRQMRRRKQSKRAQTQTQAKQNSMQKFKQSRKRQKQVPMKRSRTQDSEIFQDIQSIINSRMVNSQQKTNKQKLNLNNIRHLIKMTKINKNIRKLSPQKPISQLRKNHEETQKSSSNQKQKVVLKDSNNYYQWRRIDLSSNQNSPKYKESTFEQQNQRLGKFILKNQICLSKYFQYRQQLVMCHSTKVKNKH